MANDLSATFGLNAENFKKGLSEAKQGLGNFSKSAASIGAGMAGFQGVEAVVGKIGGAIKKAADLSDAAANVGLTVEEYQKLGFAFRDVGLSSEDADKAMSTMNAKLGEAIGGSEGANESLNKLGLTAEGLKNLSAADQFETITKAISKLPTQAERAAAATDFFGKSGKKLDQLVMGYDQVMAKAEEAGNMIGGDTADAADKLGDELAKLDDAFVALVANSGLIEFLSKAASGMVELQNTIKGGIDSLLTMEGKLKDIGGKDVSGNGAYSGSMWGNLKDAWLGEEEGQKITTGKTTKAEQQNFKKEQDDKKKQADELAQKEADMQKAAKENLQKKDKEKTSKEVDALIKKGDEFLKKSDEEAQDLIQKGKDEEAKQNEAQIKLIDDMEKEYELQQLINEGKSKEAAIQEAINKAKEAGMSDEEAQNIGKLAGQTYDIKNIPKQQFKADLTDDYLKKGLVVGNAAAASSNPAALQKKGNELLTELNKSLKEQTEKWERLNTDKSNGVS